MSLDSRTFAAMVLLVESLRCIPRPLDNRMVLAVIEVSLEDTRNIPSGLLELTRLLNTAVVKLPFRIIP